MTEEKNQCEQTQTKVELQIIPCANKVAQEKQKVEVLDHESQDDPCIGKIILTVTCDGSKLTKADSGYFTEFQQDLFVTARITNSESCKFPNIDVSVQEKCNGKLTKA